MFQSALTNDKITAVKNQELVIDCDVHGTPAPNLLWLKGGQLVKNDSRTMQFTNDGK